MAHTPDFLDHAKAPDTNLIEQGNLRAVADAIQLIWAVLQAEIRKRGIRDQQLSTGMGAAEGLSDTPFSEGPFALRWLKGPWLLDPNGNYVHVAELRVTGVSGTLHNYAPTGIHTAVVLRINLSGDATITGILRATRQVRLLMIEHAVTSNGFITLSDNNVGSAPENRFMFKGQQAKLGPGQCLWVKYDTEVERWVGNFSP